MLNNSRLKGKILINLKTKYHQALPRTSSYQPDLWTWKRTT
ncbi:hypothetical protein SynSYN20_01293 [Synechococcus sp. SYN20]|nr:hypothetical protein SynSYN20_01293 [Synechococcus sp. SYN20]